MTLPFFKNHSPGKKNFKNKGFTLIELIVTVAIALAVTGGGIAAFSKFNDKQSVLQSAKELQTMLRSAQTKAKVGEDAELCRTSYPGPPAESLRGYRVYVANGSNVATLQVVCSVGKFTPVGSRHYITPARETITFDSNVTATGEVNVEFLSLLGGVDGFGTIVLSGLSGNVYTFDVTEGGEIEEGSF